MNENNETASPSASDSNVVNASGGAALPSPAAVRPTPLTKPVSIDLESQCRQLITDALNTCFSRPGHVNYAAAAGEITSSIVQLIKNEIAKLKAE